MIRKKKIEIVAFEHERIVRRSVSYVCPVCSMQSEILTTQQACALMQVSPQSIRRWVLAGKAHGFRTPGGRLRICRNSLFILSEKDTEEKHLSEKVRLELVKYQPEKNIVE